MKPNWIFNCQEISILLSKSMDEDLSFFQRFVVKVHLVMCEMCSGKKVQLKLMKEITGMFKKHETEAIASFKLSDESKIKLKNSLKSG